MIELGHLTDHRPPFEYAAYTAVAFSENDAQGVVDYGRYLPYFDLARTEYHRHLGAIDLRGEFARRASHCDDDGTAQLLVAAAQQTLVLIDFDLRRPTPVPEPFRARVADFER